MTDAPLVLAVPSKGRLQENATAFFGRAGLKFVKASGERGYRGTIAGVEGAEVAFLSASEIVAQLASGAAHLGVTGEDLVREQLSDADAAVEMLTPLGFGHANVVVAVPQAWIDVRSMTDLEDVASTMRARHGRKLRVATKYVNLTRRFFAEHGLADYRIVESLGATEGAPAAGTAEIVVDITTTGATLAANALKVLDDGVMLASEANLVASTRAPWSARARAAVRTILSRIAAEEEGRTIREIRARLDLDAAALSALTESFGARLPFGAPLAGAPLTLHCPGKAVFALVEELDRKGADDITVTAPAYVFRRANRLLERLDARI
ncbi:MAG: ATP phosphoribosyltransferase [Bosea sp.]|uniref:ATP phosphoribosyltransferase n=1 Tax=unclassified Bosea (in: a-proteobacteria) TaxID=2653178 RepID=UPI0009619A2D|nr:MULTISPECIES: ATP phosphoribosyltransferase [unclassified Bosea (in: a-proteobacteria)]MBN9456787.1 ATP phosphoribosyltransferase [Bosea sp. (in: a-proteobacteria)]OJV08999.1 MAG: ATP phosphoribosyltransferase [Bosea sp. 67-29]